GGGQAAGERRAVGAALGEAAIDVVAGRAGDGVPGQRDLGVAGRGEEVGGRGGCGGEAEREQEGGAPEPQSARRHPIEPATSLLLPQEHTRPFSGLAPPRRPSPRAFLTAGLTALYLQAR